MADGPYLEFERPLMELEKKISDMKDFSVGENLELGGEIAQLEQKLERLRGEIYSSLTRWQRVQISRHPRRPYTRDYIDEMCSDFVEIHGDRGYADDPAMIGGFATIEGNRVMIVGQQKGRDTKQKLYRNFGMAHPEGYRKARRLFFLAEKFGLPILILIDTPGAYPGIGAEERGQAEAIALNIKTMFAIRVPIIVGIIGEGASGGALGIGVGDEVFMLEHSWYSVISPEGCAAILWRDAAKAPEAAEALKVTAEDLESFGIVDKVIPEPARGAHNDMKETARRVKTHILETLERLRQLDTEELLRRRLEKFRVLGYYEEE